MLEGCGLDPDLTRPSVLVSIADYARRLKGRRFTPDDIRQASATWAECFPNRGLEDIEPPHPQQLAEWVGRRKAAEALRKAAGPKADRAASRAGHGLVPMIEY